MTTVNYPSPVTVNGYACKNCTDVDYAKQHIDPAHPKDGPYRVNAKAQSTVSPRETPAVTFGSALAKVAPSANPAAAPTAAQGQRLDVFA
jgi:hypothetical protein